MVIKLEITRKQAIEILKECKKEPKSSYSNDVLLEMINSIEDFNGKASNDEIDGLITDIFGADEIVIKKEKERGNKNEIEKDIEKEVTEVSSKETENKKENKKENEGTKEMKTTTKTSKKQTRNVTKNLSTKEQIWDLFQKVDSGTAKEHVEKWSQKFPEVKRNTINSWVGSWKRNRNLPSTARKQ
jgi:hypothetical protein